VRTASISIIVTLTVLAGCEAAPTRVQRSSAPASTVTHLADGLPGIVSMATDGTDIFLVQQQQQYVARLLRLPIAGGTPAPFGPQVWPAPLMVDATNLYLTGNSGVGAVPKQVAR
jgi:hypothetical protein